VVGWVRRVFDSYSAQGHAKDEAFESRVGDEQVAAAAQHEERDAALAGPGRGFVNLLFAYSLNKPARRAANAEGGEGRERLVLFKKHRLKGYTTG
jgi:predicted lipid-binding transport protein (Tim44 family)